MNATRLPLLLACLAAPAAAETLYTLPQGCTAYATAQLKSCEVAHFYRCQGDRLGDQHAVYIDADGPRFTSRIDAETNWSQSHSFRSGVTNYLNPEAEDFASFSTLISTGRDDYSFSRTNSNTEIRLYKGEDWLLNETVKIDGVSLEKVAYDQSAYAPDGTLLWRDEGEQYINRSWRRFLSGTSTTTYPDGTVTESDDSPVSFAFPGEPGFLTATPTFGCGILTTALPSDAILASLKK